MSPDQSKIILIIEDSLTYQQALKREFAALKYEVICAETGEKGLEAVHNKRPHLIILDLTLPGINGQEVCRELKMDFNYRDIPVMVLTMHDDEEIVMKGLEAGADGYVNKNEPLSLIVKRAESFLQTSKELPPMLEQGQESSSFSLSSKEVLVVDDDLTYVQAAKRSMAEEGYQVRTAMSGQECLVKIEEKVPDLVLLDLKMPEMDGSQTCRAIRAKYKVEDLPIVILTASEVQEDVARSFEAGATDYVVKSGDFRVIKLRIYSILRRKHFERETEKIRGQLYDAEKKALIAHSEKEAEQKFSSQLAEEKERLMVVLRSIGDGVVAVDEQGKTTIINEAAERLLNCTSEEALGLSLGEIFVVSQSDENREKESLSQKLSVVDKEIYFFDQLKVKSLSGKSCLLEGIKSPMFDQNKGVTGAVFVFRDIESRQKVQEELQKTSKLEAIGTLAAGIAHDFNNLLTVILGNISLTKTMLTDSPQVTGMLTEAEKATEKATHLSNQLLTFSKGGSPVKSVENIAGIVKESSAFVTTGSNVVCEIKASDDLWDTEVDKNQIFRAIQAVVLNSKEAMEDGGVVDISIENVEFSDDDKRKEFLKLSKGKHLQINIKDQGCGIPEENLSKVFDPFFSTKMVGSGLGLMTALSIVEKHNGAIDIKSELKKGTSIDIYLPATEEKKPVKKKEKEVALMKSEPSNGGPIKRVLLMDDEDQVLNLAALMCKKAGLEPTLTHEGSEAVDLYKKSKEEGAPFDLVIMDLTIPAGMGGKEAIGLLREIDPDVRAIVSSGYSNDPVMANYQEYGFKGVMAKPYKLDLLKELVKDLFDTP